jgi:hypothetical protein
MTPAEFAMQMRAQVARPDDGLGSSHVAMDILMCELLRELGYEEGVKVFERAEKRYA